MAEEENEGQKGDLERESREVRETLAGEEQNGKMPLLPPRLITFLALRS